jgi:uncharacterized protein YecE (DUF72 family)
MKFLIGTSGYSYPKWRGVFYPPKMKPEDMLPFYSSKFPTVELNNTFYRAPDSKLVASWAAATPKTFRFAVKSPQTITHRKRLKDCEAECASLFETLSELKPRLGPILFGLPPNLKKDLPRLEAFAKLVKKHAPAAFEFRNDSWLDDETCDVLKHAGHVLCQADTDEQPLSKLTTSGDWGYIRLRRDHYSDAELAAWLKQIQKQPWDKAYVYFKHDDAGQGAVMALKFQQLANSD